MRGRPCVAGGTVSFLLDLPAMNVPPAFEENKPKKKKLVH